jgi:hypothetical protein
LRPVTWAYTDSHDKRATFLDLDTDVPVGRWDDAKGAHRSRSYFTYDLSATQGATFLQAHLVAREAKVTDCTAMAPVEVWRTAPITSRTSWANPPKEIERVARVDLGGGAPCPGNLIVNLTSALNAALERKDKRITVELRLPADQENDAKLGRFFSRSASVSADVNHRPVVSDLSLWNGTGCGTRDKNPVTSEGGGTVEAKATDQDKYDFLQGTFAAWPVDHPEQRQERGASFYADGTMRTQLDLSGYPHGTTVAWTARVFDRYDYSGWAGPCYFTLDTQAPAKAPVVSSTDYPEGVWSGGPGVPGKFRLDAQGDPDVVAYQYRDISDATTTVPAPRPGAPVTVTYTPDSDGPNPLRVVAIDAAGNRSPQAEYWIYVGPTGPDIQVDVAGVNLPSRLTVKSPVAGVTCFTYQIENGKEVRLPAVNGTATTPITFTSPGFFRVTVRTFVGSRMVGLGHRDVRVEDAPIVESPDFAADHNGVVGREGGFTFKPRRAGVKRYLYSFNNEPERQVTAAADGTATLRWTPTDAGFHTLHVRSEDAAGTKSSDTGYQFSVIDPRPTVYSPDLSSWPRRDGVGVPLRFAFTTGMPDVTAFLYRFDGAAEQTVEAEFGQASVTLTPSHSGKIVVDLRSRFADGTYSAVRTTEFTISSGPVVTTPPGAPQSRLGRPTTFRFRPGLPGVTEYRYSFAGGTEQTVAAGADGSASVDYTPTSPGYDYVDVVSRSADGTLSDPRKYEFIVLDTTVSVYGFRYGPDRVFGGIGVPGGIVFSSQLASELADYTYRLNDGPEQVVAAATDGVSTDVIVVPDRNGTNVLRVQSRSRDGYLSPVTEFRFLVGTAPYVTSTEYPEGGWGGKVGAPGSFAFSGGTAGIVAFEYRVNDGAPTETAADAAGGATVSFTPTVQFDNAMKVRGRKADGTFTDETTYRFYVNP